MIAPMQRFLGDYPNEGKNLQARPDFASEFVHFHQQLVREDLPRHKERFRDFLNTNLTENIGGLEAMLDAEVKLHRERIEQVNRALCRLDYGDGTFGEIVRRDTKDMGIREFKGKLRDCLGAGLNYTGRFAKSWPVFRIGRIGSHAWPTADSGSTSVSTSDVNRMAR